MHTPFDPSLPLAQAATLPNHFYFDEAIYQKEREKVFLDGWLAVGRTDQLEKAGSFFTLELAGEPLVVSRDKQGALHAFTNVCRHRAARVVTAAEGCASFFQCRYHGWTYDLTGKLKGTPQFEGVENFEKADHPLPSWKIDTWGPFVFVSRNPNIAPLLDFLSPLPEKTAMLGLDKLKFQKRSVYDIECNWKVFVDNYLDGGYHINTIHPALAGVLDDSQYTTDIFSASSLQSSPLQSSSDAGVTSVRKGDRAHYWWLYPNFMINIYDGVLDTNTVYPVGPNKCRVVFDYYFADISPENQAYIARSTEVAHQVQLEDLEICQDVQNGLKSLSYVTGRFSVKREKAGYHFHQMIARKLC